MTSDQEKAADIQPGDTIGFLLAKHRTFGVVTTQEAEGVHLASEKFHFFVKWSKIVERHRVVPGEGTASRYYEQEESQA